MGDSMLALTNGWNSCSGGLTTDHSVILQLRHTRALLGIAGASAYREDAQQIHGSGFKPIVAMPMAAVALPWK